MTQVKRDASVPVQFTMPNSLYVDMLDEAEKANESRSEFIRDAVHLRILLIRQEREKAGGAEN